MKYLKTFEDKEVKYSIGEYVLLDKNTIEINSINAGDDLEYFFDEYSKIVDYQLIHEYPINVIFYNGKKLWVNEYEIDRKMTTEEIENFMIKSSATKYNL